MRYSHVKGRGGEEHTLGGRCQFCGKGWDSGWTQEDVDVLGAGTKVLQTLGMA